MVLVLLVGLAACGGSGSTTASSSAPAQLNTEIKNAEFTPEQQALVQKFLGMAEGARPFGYFDAGCKRKSVNLYACRLSPRLANHNPVANS